MRGEDFFRLVNWFREEKLFFEIVLYSGRTIANVEYVSAVSGSSVVAWSDVKSTKRGRFIKGKPTGFNLNDVEIISPSGEIEVPKKR